MGSKKSKKSKIFHVATRKYNSSATYHAHQRQPLWFPEKPEIKPVITYKLDPLKLDDLISNKSEIFLKSM
ncbi:hypothetical protein NIES25_52380 [Nostoc linckia NIES-25]|nr:hypothetical protein NIES25_52380 [Nostoc linckia NIES-25]